MLNKLSNSATVPIIFLSSILNKFPFVGEYVLELLYLQFPCKFQHYVIQQFIVCQWACRIYYHVAEYLVVNAVVQLFQISVFIFGYSSSIFHTLSSGLYNLELRFLPKHAAETLCLPSELL